jgi:hypothetical protein
MGTCKSRQRKENIGIPVLQRIMTQDTNSLREVKSSQAIYLGIYCLTCKISRHPELFCKYF